MQNEHAQSLAEIMESKESMERAAEDFVQFCDAQAKSTKNVNSDIKSDEDFSALLTECGKKDDEFYKKICEIDVYDD